MNPTAFLSYSHDSNEHANNVLALSDRLRSEGIDVRLDQYETSPPEGWPRWMEGQINSCDFVLCVCTPTYYRRVMGLEKPGAGMGVRWEGHLIYQHLYNAGARNEKFIPILYTYSSAAQIPVPLQSATYYFADKDEDYEKLYRCLRGVKAKGKPDLGPLRPLPEQERRTDVGMFVTGFIDLDLWNKAKWQGTVYLHDAQGLEPPWLALLFTESEPAEAIFEQWHKRLGRSDSYNELRISIIEGDIPGEENGYSVHVSANIENIFKRADDQGIDLPQPYVMMVSRLNRMNPAPDSQNLAMFKERFRRFGCYYLIPAAMTPEGVVTFTKHRILKRNVEFRSTAEIISKNDPDSAVLPQFRSRENE